MVHLADLAKKWLREASLSARRGPVVHRATTATSVHIHHHNSPCNYMNICYSNIHHHYNSEDAPHHDSDNNHHGQETTIDPSPKQQVTITTTRKFHWWSGTSPCTPWVDVWRPLVPLITVRECPVQTSDVLCNWGEESLGVVHILRNQFLGHFYPPP